MKEKLSTGLEGQNIPESFYIPPCGIEDIDRAVFELFDNRLKFEVNINKELTKVPVVFSTGERFSLSRRAKPIRDKNNAIILPVIAIKRNVIEHSPSMGGLGTSIAFRSQGDMIVRRRLAKEDKTYQRLINKNKIKNQDNVASRKNYLENSIFPGNVAKPGTESSRNNKDNLSFHDSVTGRLFETDLGDNVFEIIAMPYPKFVTISYQITVWTQYVQHMNQMIENLITKFDGQEKGYMIETSKGYRFTLYTGDTFQSGDNFENFSSDERIVRMSFDAKVPGYIIATQNPGDQIPFRSFISAPKIEFGMSQISATLIESKGPDIRSPDINKFILSDVQNLDKHGNENIKRGNYKYSVKEIVKDPFSGKEEKKIVKVISRNQRAGETVARSRTIIDLETTND
jgi:hypothetical protein